QTTTFTLFFDNFAPLTQIRTPKTYIYNTKTPNAPFPTKQYRQPLWSEGFRPSHPSAGRESEANK
ncbi:MAG: hypothetical protein IKL83_04645, partial [Muribaculaceae bacterium]|nr:hypothetical protein [Muribaculaceae bacterium]